MANVSGNLSRTSSQMSANIMLNNLRRTNVDILRAQEALSSGRQVNLPSDAPESISVMNQMMQLLGRMDQQSVNLTRAEAITNVTDQALADMSDLILGAENIAQTQIGPLTDSSTRQAQAEVVSSMIESLREMASRHHNGIYLFSGRASDVNPFEDALGGMRYVGSTENMTADLGPRIPIGINTNGAEALGALSSRVEGTVDLNPNATNATRIKDVHGARNLGVTLGSIQVDVNGTISDVDLTGADTLEDLTELINNAIGGSGGLAVGGNGFVLTANAGQTITISDYGSGVTTADLGINISATSGAMAGGDLNAKLTELTAVSAFSGGLDLVSGMTITNGGKSATLDFTSATTVKDMLNVVNGAGLGVRMSINSDGTGFNLLNEVSGTEMTVGEAGGSTASDFGLRSFSGVTQLSELNHGTGVRVTSGEADIRITVHSGAQYDINLDGLTDINDVINQINTDTGGDVTASLAVTGNGIVLTDNTGAGAEFSVVSINNSYAAEDLGIEQNVGTGSSLSGSDVATVRSESVFTHLYMLRDALRANDERMITIAGEKLNEDIDRIALTRAKVGIRARRVVDEQSRVADRQILTQQMLSDIQDTDFTEVISRYTLLQQQLQATLLAGQQSQQLSLLDFI